MFQDNLKDNKIVTLVQIFKDNLKDNNINSNPNNINNNTDNLTCQVYY